MQPPHLQLGVEHLLSNKVVPNLKGRLGNLQGISGCPGSRDETEIISSLSLVNILHDGNPTLEC